MSCWRRCWTMVSRLQPNQTSSKRWSGLLPFYDQWSIHLQVSRDQQHQLCTYFSVRHGMCNVCMNFNVSAHHFCLYITGGSNVGETLPTGQLSNIPWRRSGVKYTNNEAYFDVVEEIDAILDKSGADNCFVFITKYELKDICFAWHVKKLISFKHHMLQVQRYALRSRVW